MKAGMINNDMVNMKEISKTAIIFLVMGCFSVGLFSCKRGTFVNFESDAFEEFKKREVNSLELPDDFYYTRIMTTECVDLIFRKFSLKNEFENINVKNITIADDKGNVIYRKEEIELKPTGFTYNDNNCNYQIYSYEIDNNEFNRDELRSYKTKYITVNFEINGKTYSETLKKTVSRYPIMRT